MAQIITINKNDELFPESFKAIGEDCPERIYEIFVVVVGDRLSVLVSRTAQHDMGELVATGLDKVHPHENIPLQEEILRKGGLILSEQPLGVKANPTRLVARNRLQAALSEEMVVAECPIHSGTMHTVRFAQKYGKAIKAAKFPYDKDENSGNKHIIKTGIGTGI